MARSKSKKYRDNPSGNSAPASPRKPQKKKTLSVTTEDSAPELELNQQIDELIKSIEASMNTNAGAEPSRQDDIQTESDPKESHDEPPADESILNEPLSELVADSESNFNKSETAIEETIDEPCIDFKSTNLSDETTDQNIEPQFDGLSPSLELRIDQLFHQLESKFETWLVQLQDKVQQFQFSHVIHAPSDGASSHAVQAANRHGHGNGATSNQSVSAVESDWEIRKRQMLSEIGLSSEEIEQIVPPPKAAIASTRDETHGRVELNDAPHCVAVHIPEPIETVHSSEEIEQLKEQLNAKLREAEVELAINRAKLSKEWASLEQQKAALTQREADWRSKYTNADGCPTTNVKKGILDRFARHMTKRNDK